MWGGAGVWIGGETAINKTVQPKTICDIFAGGSDGQKFTHIFFNRIFDPAHQWNRNNFHFAAVVLSQLSECREGDSGVFFVQPGHPKLKFPLKIDEILNTKASCGARLFEEKNKNSTSCHRSSIIS